MKKESWQPCPRCGSKKVVKNELAWFFFLFGTVALGFSFFLSILFLPFGIIGFLLGMAFLGYGVIVKIKNKGVMQCLDCRNSFRPKPGE